RQWLHRRRGAPDIRATPASRTRGAVLAVRDARGGRATVRLSHRRRPRGARLRRGTHQRPARTRSGRLSEWERALDVEVVLGKYSGRSGPASATPARRPGSVRRTTTHDSSRLEGLLGPITVAARGRDLYTPHYGAPRVVGEAQLDVHVDGTDRSIV